MSTTKIETDPRVGIYWGLIHAANELELVVDTTSLPEAEPYGDFLTHPRGHYEVWESWQQTGPQGLARMKLPKLIAWTEYEAIPRGRVVYNTTTRHFTVYADRRLQRPPFGEIIAGRFGLLSQSYSMASDPHYRVSSRA